ncbi:M24 family metallopeptidase [Parasphingopyxis algicola]|uniref:M24 family metallopeptidase n=1 Tax=Parasphingopyxis algicola TaxID=2026624 RepID=UPI0015A04DC8|nr:Xaa-Pro peptidase family protein [Parasphingopyxis algicola]QLC23924.1 M24 family metallopeptidase [Parasphingopyxis algicola]
MTEKQLFTQSEFDRRLVRVRTAMEAERVDAIVVSDPNNIYYLTGYSGISHYVPQGLLVTADDIRFLMREMDVLGARITSWLPSEAIVGYGDDTLLSAKRTPWHLLADMIRSLGLHSSRIGFGQSSNFISPIEWSLIESLLPDARLHDTRLLVNHVRAIKSVAEIAYMREAAQISDAALKDAVEMIAPGVRECDLAGKITARLVGGTAEFGGGMAYPPMMPSGEKTSTPHLMWTDDPYSSDTQVNIEVGGMRHWYVSPASRSIKLGKPSAKLRDLEAVTVEGMEAALDKAAPGIRCEEIEQAFRNVTACSGYEKTSRIGYAVGLGFLPPGWIELTSNLASGDRTELRPGMTYHLMLGMWFPGDSFVLSETFVVTDTGCESLCSMPRELMIKEN